MTADNIDNTPETQPTSTTEDLKEVRRRLSRGMESLSKEGFEFEKYYGSGVYGRGHTPHILVRAELRRQNGLFYHFKVFVDFHLPVGADAGSAKEFAQLAGLAARKAQWAEKIVAGHAWIYGDIA